MSILDSPRDQFLDMLSYQDWSNREDGSVEAPTGYFVAMSLTPEDYTALHKSFHEVIVTEYGLNYSDLYGHWLLQYDSAGFMHVTEYASHQTMIDAYLSLEARFTAWEMEDDEVNV